MLSPISENLRPFQLARTTLSPQVKSRLFLFAGNFIADQNISCPVPRRKPHMKHLLRAPTQGCGEALKAATWAGLCGSLLVVGASFELPSPPTPYRDRLNTFSKTIQLLSPFLAPPLLFSSPARFQRTVSRVKRSFRRRR